MPNGVFVTGTDTGVGKTVVSAALMHRYRGLGEICYWKPIQTGIEQDDDTAIVRELGGCKDCEILSEGVRLRRPLSPHLAARLSGQRIDLDRLMTSFLKVPATAVRIVEGAGGALVPINNTELMTHLIQQLGLPILIVARSGLGTINHTLLTIEALRNRSLNVAGVVMVGDENSENRAAIEHYGEAHVIGELPHLTPLSTLSLATWSVSRLDSNGSLWELLK
ncbi:MAG TPA: dethiobiotin synthase [Blastocatellia bacterium]|nr:dethiobiotin synthase [Blastocatellia bacterium]